MEQEIQQQPQIPPTNENKATLAIVVSIVATALVVGVGVYLFLNKSPKQPETNNTLPNQTTESGGIKDVHHWNSKPTEANNINLAKGLFGLPDGYVRAWELGTYSEGYGIQSLLDGAKILLVVIRDPAHGQGPFGTEPTAACDSVARIFIYKTPSGNSVVVYDERYSPDDIVDQGFRFIFETQFYQSGGIPVIPSLDFPGFVVHGQQTFVRQRPSFPCFVVDTQGKTKIFFDDIKSSLQPTFTDPVLGTAYEDKSEGDIVFRASDGTYVRYSPVAK